MRELGVKPKKIKQAHQVIAQFLKTPFPFAHSKLLSDGKTVFLKDEVNNIINAEHSLQLNMREMIEPFCAKIEFDGNDLPERFYPMGPDKDVVVDPQHQFGMPTIKGTNIRVEVLYNLYRGGEPISSIAHLYDLPENSVQDAIEYYKAA